MARGLAKIPGDDKLLRGGKRSPPSAIPAARSHDEEGRGFESATLDLPLNSRWVRFEIVGLDGSKAWSNPFDLTAGTELARPAVPARSD